MGNVWCHWLVDAARMAVAGTGLSVIVQPGWESRGHGGLRLVEVVVGHHTATPESSPGDYPSLHVVTNGRSDLPGPLANLGLGRSGNVYVIAAGLAYHAGASAYAGYYDLNDESLGIEAEDSGDGVWTDAQLFMYPRLVGALLHYMRRGADRYCSHRTCATPAGRKPDPAGISDGWMHSQITIPPQEDDMDATQDQRLKNVETWLASFLHAYGEFTDGSALERNRHDQEMQGGLRALLGMGVSPGASGTVKPGTPLPPLPAAGEPLPIVTFMVKQEAALATILAAQQDDVSDQDVLDRIGQHVDAGLAELAAQYQDQLLQLRLQLEAARAEDRAAMEAAIRESLPADLAEQVVTELAGRLRPAA
jgi:hypothetical protein